MSTYTSDQDIEAVLRDVRAESAACSGGPDDDVAQLLQRADDLIVKLQKERDDEIRRYVDGLDAWRRNNAHGAVENDRLQKEVARLTEALIENSGIRKVVL